MRIVIARTVTETEIPALAPEESWRSVGRRARGVSVGEEGEVVGLEGVGLWLCEGFAGALVGPVGVALDVGGNESVLEEVGAAAFEELGSCVVETLEDSVDDISAVELGLSSDVVLVDPPSSPSPMSTPVDSQPDSTCCIAFCRSSVLHLLFRQLSDADSTVPFSQ
jgi:hypothetical protein